MGTMARIPDERDQVTGLLHAWGAGDEQALQRLVPLVEAELHRIARRCMKAERAGHSLQATALVNEAYLRLVDVQRVQWQDRAHFLAMSARLMRRVLVDHARARGYQKRGGAPFASPWSRGSAAPTSGPTMSWRLMTRSLRWRRWILGRRGWWNCAFSAA